jgi:hypothetical protein
MPARIKPGGVGIYTCDGLETWVDTATCSHCQRIIDIPSRRKMHEVSDVCRACMKIICVTCAGQPCVTWLKKCDIEEALERRRRWA